MVLLCRGYVRIGDGKTHIFYFSSYLERGKGGSESRWQLEVN